MANLLVLNHKINVGELLAERFCDQLKLDVCEQRAQFVDTDLSEELRGLQATAVKLMEEADVLLMGKPQESTAN